MPRGRSCLSCADMEEGRYETPPASELQRLLWVRSGPSGHLDEVRPGIYIGDMYAAKDKRTLQALNITHVLNAAHGKFNVNTGPSYYRDTNIIYHGVEAFDMSSFDMSPFFYSAAKFIKSAMSTPGGKVFVHCAMGLSRSSTLVLAYLMIHEDMTLPEAIKAVAQSRNICPNPGFLEQLRQLDQQLHCQGRVGTADPVKTQKTTAVAPEADDIEDPDDVEDVEEDPGRIGHRGVLSGACESLIKTGRNHPLRGSKRM
ncbi:dual specificity protein phosphatase 13-like [Chanos chanos]|uniref:Dual specificity protein phosphatase 13-like n=1 Tax=Chanos chanos TaxID=29144 RepID=A0A6J2VFM1_CHACN|nr:dual specificity protein phosphatase 13-like [Chanos chanos]